MLRNSNKLAELQYRQVDGVAKYWPAGHPDDVNIQVYKSALRIYVAGQAAKQVLDVGIYT